MDLLPEDLLVDILRRLPPRPLTVCRSVSKDLRAIIDGRGLLLAVAHRVPHGLRGMFINFAGQDQPYFFSRPASSAIDAELSFVPLWYREIVHQCNGLLLFQDWRTLYVCNPATRRWEQLPPPPSSGRGRTMCAYLAFDPTVSLHYDVFIFAEAPCKPKIKRGPGYNKLSKYYEPREIKDGLPASVRDTYDQKARESLPASVRDKYDLNASIKGSQRWPGSAQWPPSSYMAQVYSSRTGQWEERAYVREDAVAVTLWDVWSDPTDVSKSYDRENGPRCNAVHWRGAFYIQCRGGFIMRLSLLEQKYQVIKTPKLENIFMARRLDIPDFLREEGFFQCAQEDSDKLQPSMHLGKSEHGIYYTALRWHQLYVWVLQEVSEFRSMPEWELKYKADIKPSFLQHYERVDRKEIQEGWMLDRGQMGSEGSREDCGWDSSDDSDINVEEENDEEEEEEEDDEEEEEEYDEEEEEEEEENAEEEEEEDDEEEEVEEKGRENRRRMDRYYGIQSSMDFLGFHPRKEIAFLGNRFDGFAYYLSTSKLQYLGTFKPVGCCHMQVAATHESFIYTPCMDDFLPAHLEVEDEDSECWEEEDNVDE